MERDLNYLTWIQVMVSGVTVGVHVWRRALEKETRQDKVIELVPEEEHLKQ